MLKLRTKTFQKYYVDGTLSWQCSNQNGISLAQLLSLRLPEKFILAYV